MSEANFLTQIARSRILTTGPLTTSVPACITNQPKALLRPHLMATTQEIRVTWTTPAHTRIATTATLMIQSLAVITTMTRTATTHHKTGNVRCDFPLLFKNPLLLLLLLIVVVKVELLLLLLLLLVMVVSGFFVVRVIIVIVVSVVVVFDGSWGICVGGRRWGFCWLTRRGVVLADAGTCSQMFGPVFLLAVLVAVWRVPAAVVDRLFATVSALD